MAAVFTLGMAAYYVLVLRRHKRRPALAKLLWTLYFGLGVSAMVIAAADVLNPVFPPNYVATLFLLSCVLISISGFLRFDPRHVGQAVLSIRGQGLIEGILISLQFYASAFFLPFAIASLIGDANENRLDLANKMEVLASFGLFNTLAGAASQLFGASLLLAGVRLAQPVGLGRSPARAVLLILASLSYVIYILAYVGRDGVVYWMMTALAVFVVFRDHIPRALRRQIVAAGAALAALMLVPFIAITLARFVDSEYGSAWSVLDYFGSQINNFSDYSSLDRPLTFGIMNFPMFVTPICSVVGLDCDNWEDLKEVVFAQYLEQDKAPWLFGTFVSDFAGDFGYTGTFVSIVGLAWLSRRFSIDTATKPMTIARMLMVMFLFLVPYWGVFYFRFSIINGFIVVNLAFIVFVHLVQKLGARSRRHRLGR